MSHDKHHSEQFERYLKGQMSPEEAHAFEREVLDDPFAQEALEGFENEGINALKDLQDLESRIQGKQKKSLSWMRVAAVIAILAVGSFTVYFFTDQIEGEQLAMDKEQVEELTQSEPGPDTIRVGLKKEAQVSEETQMDTFKKDGLKVANEDEEVVRLAEENSDIESRVEDNEIAKVALDDNLSTDSAEGKGDALQLAEVEEEVVMEEAQPEDLSGLLQGRAAGVQIAETKPAPNEVSVDTSSLDEVVITTQPLIAKKESVSSATTAVNKAEVRQRSRQATARSQSENSETVSGTVTDDTGEPLPGVNVVIKGTTTGVITDVDGNYQLLKTGNVTLIYSFVGFESQEVAVGDRSIVDVTMGGATELQEVVVTGYGSEDESYYYSFTPAKPISGSSAYKKYLEENLQYPEAAKTNEVEGTVVLELTINTVGEIDQIDIKKSLGYGCDEEAIRLVSEGPKWEAAEKNGSPVEDKVKIRVRFKLE